MAHSLKPTNRFHDSRQQVMRLEHFLALPIACCVARTYAVEELVNRIHCRAVATAQLLA
jgi:hypothetical protein